MEPVKVGLVGSGQWARTMHAPMHSSGQETVLSGIWSPNAEKASRLADEFGVAAFRSFDELLDRSEAVDFAVPPGVQAELGVEAALAGRALMLEKPLAVDIDAAEKLVQAIELTRVANLVVLTKRYHERTKAFLRDAYQLRSSLRLVTGRYVHGGFLDDGFIDNLERTGWRRSFGVLFDLGPHLLDLAEAAAGQILTVQAFGDPDEILELRTSHSTGAAGHFVVSGRIAVKTVLTDLDLYANDGHLDYSTRGLDLSEAVRQIRSEFASAVRHGGVVTTDARRALSLQYVIHAAAQSIQDGTEVRIHHEPGRSLEPS